MKLKKSWNLSVYLAKTGFKMRNEGSYLGILWYLLNPFLFFTLLYVIFSRNIGSGIQSYPLYLFIGIIMFNLFQSCADDSISAIRDNRFFLKSINFPRESLIAGNILKFLFSHLFEIIALGIFMIFLGSNPLYLLAYIPVLFFFILFIFGASLILGSISVYLVDTKNIWSFASKLLWFATPIFYSAGSSKTLSVINSINPLYYFMTCARSVIIDHSLPSANIILGAAGFSIVFPLIGILIFSKLKSRFAEKI